MQLTEIPEVVTWPETYYVYIEKTGSFMEVAPQAWNAMHQKIPDIAQHNTVTGYMSVYRLENLIYRAGVAMEAPPRNLPGGLQFEVLPGGRYSRFTLTGSYANLSRACGRVFEIIKQENMPVREGFFIENYVKDPRITPEDQLVTEILVPLA